MFSGYNRDSKMNSNESTDPTTSGSGHSRKRKANEADGVEDRKVEHAFDDEHEDDDEDANDDNCVTMLDVLEEEQQLEEEAFALLGGSDDKNCTYLHGYVNRQAIYACRTCRMNEPETLDQDDISGLCLACSYACHEGHDLYELYTKRNFKCDCGNSKMRNHGKCALFANKSAVNEQNKYNHNFFGRYCLCDRPYPDPDGDSGIMVQCVVCEDWYHDYCLKTRFPKNDDFGELICAPCMDRHDFLWDYHRQQPTRLQNLDESSDTLTVDVIEAPVTGSTTTHNIATTTGETGTDSGIESSCDSMLDANHCKLKGLQSATGNEKKNAADDLKSRQVRSGATFWDEGWRKQLCRCNDCVSMYRTQQIDFLCDDCDTVHHYEAKGKEKGVRMSHYERGLNEITKMDRVQSIDAITG